MTTPTKEQTDKAIDVLFRCCELDAQGKADDAAAVVAMLIADKESAEAERDRLRKALEDLTIGTATPDWGAQGEEELGPIWREAQAELIARAAAALAAGEGAKA